MQTSETNQLDHVQDEKPDRKRDRKRQESRAAESLVQVQRSNSHAESHNESNGGNNDSTKWILCSDTAEAGTGGKEEDNAESKPDEDSHHGLPEGRSNAVEEFGSQCLTP